MERFIKKQAEGWLPQEEIVKTQWDKRYKEEQPYKESPSVPSVKGFFEKYGEEFKGGKVLDLGCGNGRNLRHIAKLGFETHGIDISKEGLKQLKESLEKESLSADIKQGSFYNLSYNDKIFDCIVSINALQHNDWKGAEKSFAEAARVLKNKGLFLLQVRSTNRELPKDRKDIFDRGITFIPETGTKAGIFLHNYSREEIEELALRNSLEILDIEEQIKEKEEERRGHWTVVFRKEAND